MSLDLVLLGTESCHLCEQAEELVLSILPQYSREVGVVKIDIVEESQYLAVYGLKIPVLCHIDSGKELNWPFSKIEVLRFLNEISA